MKVLFTPLFMVFSGNSNLFIKHNFLIIFILLENLGCLPGFGQFSVFFLRKKPKSPGFENSRLTGLTYIMHVCIYEFVYFDIVITSNQPIVYIQTKLMSRLPIFVRDIKPVLFSKVY